MPEMSIKQPADVGQLIGWTIKHVKVLSGPDSILEFELTHPVAECPVRLRIISGVNFGRSGSVVILNSTLTLHTEDVR